MQTPTALDRLLIDGPICAVSKIVETILQSSHNEESLHNLEQLFQRPDSINDTTIDILLRNLLVYIVKNLKDGDQKKNDICKVLDRLILGPRKDFVKKLVARSMLGSVPTDDASKILCLLCQRFQDARYFPQFVDLMIEVLDSSHHSFETYLFQPDFLEYLGECAVKLPINKNLELWKRISELIGRQWTPTITEANENFAKPRIAAQILSTLLLNIKLADYSVRDDTIEEAMKLLATITNILKSLFDLALQNPKAFLSPLLTLAFSFGELHQLLLLYSPMYVKLQPIKPENLESVQDEAWDFSFFHTYASSEQWVQLAKETQQTYVSDWAPITLQKIRYLILSSGRQRSKQEKSLKKLIGYLIEHINVCQSLWLNNAKYIVPFMSPKQLGTLGKRMIESRDSWQRVLSDQDVTEKRTMQMSLICAVFGSIHDHCRKRKANNDGLALTSGTLSVLQMFSIHTDVWISSVDRSHKEVTGWLRQSAEHLRESMRATSTQDESQPVKNEHDLTELLSPLDTLESLPLEYAVGPVRTGALMGLLSLLISCSQEKIKSRIWLMIVRLLDTEKNSPLFQYFPIAEFMVWAVSDIRHSPERDMILSTLMDEVFKSPKSSKDSVAWLSEATLTVSSLPFMILSMKKLIQHEQSSEKIFSVLRKRFLAIYEEGLNTHPVDVYEGVLCLLKLYIERLPRATVASKEGKDGAAKVKPLKIKKLLKKLPQLVETARTGLFSTDELVGTASCAFLSFMLANQRSLAKYFTRDPKMNLWNAYRLSPNPVRWQDRLLRQLIAKTNKKELFTMANTMMDDLQSVTAKALEENVVDEENFEMEVLRVSSFFRHLATVEFSSSDDRYAVRLQAIQTALPLIQHLILSVCRNDKGDANRVVRFAIPPMGIYLAILNETPVYAYPHDLASPLHACLALPLNATMSADDFESIFTAIYKTLHYLLTKHEEVAADRVPVLLQVYRRLMACTCTRSSSLRRCDESEVARLTDSANRLSRLASVINTQPLRYRRAAAYIIADLLSELKKQPLYLTVKQELTTALHHLMDLLDQHATRYLMAVLPPGIHELFRLEYEQFEKFYKFKGKV